MVRIEMENGGIIDIELYADKAPITVHYFYIFLIHLFHIDPCLSDKYITSSSLCQYHLRLE